MSLEEMKVEKVEGLDSKFAISEKDISILRKLAHKKASLAQRPDMEKKAKLWQMHNDLQTDEPLVFIDPENGWDEIILQNELECESPLAREWEYGLKKEIFWVENLKDDKVIDMDFCVPYCSHDTGWGVDCSVIGGGDGGAYAIKQAIEDYEEDFEKIHHPQIVIDWEESDKLLETAHAVFDGILTVKRGQGWWWTLGMSGDYIALRGLEDFMCDFLLEPEWVDRMFQLLCKGKLEMLDFLEKNNLLSQNTGNSYVGSGGFGFTNQIAAKGPGEIVTPMDMWGFCESQETVSVSPDMYGEFLFPYHKQVMERFGLNCYGCCEPYDPRWKYIKQLPRLRRVSVSPWADWSTVPEYLGKDYIASVKPSPTPLAMHDMNEDVVRADCRRAAEQTKGGICEFIMKDNNTLGNNPNNAVRWVEIMREEISRVYG